MQHSKVIIRLHKQDLLQGNYIELHLTVHVHLINSSACVFSSLPRTSGGSV